MGNSAEKNAARFTGFAELYELVRPAMPQHVVDLIGVYLGKASGRVVDMGCGTGLSTLIWVGHCSEVIGIEPSADMLSVARTKQAQGISFVQAYAHDTGIESGSADVVICSQSFHWMEPASTLAEAGRVLAPGGVFAAVDCDWPPVCGLDAEIAYNHLMDKVSYIEATEPALRDASMKWDKNGHLRNIAQSGLFRYARELVFSNTESCTAERLIGLALSQGGLQAALKFCPERIQAEAERFRAAILDTYRTAYFPIDFGYRLRIGVK